jgi:integrase
MLEEPRYQPYRVIKRKTRKGKTVFYVRFIDLKTGEVVKECSSRQTSRGAATRWAELELEKVQEQVKDAETLASLVDGFWDWDATYARGRRARGKSLSRGTLDNAESNTRNHVLPRWGDFRVTEITTAEIDTWILGLQDEKGLAASTVNKILQNLRTLLDGAMGQGMIRFNPAKAVEPLSERHKKRGVLTDDEIRRLLVWPGPFTDHRVYTMNLLAFSTGMRMGEARGLLVEDVKDDHILIQHSWEQGYGIKPPKYGRSRAVPIPVVAQEALREVMEFFAPETLVFFGRDKSTPLSKDYVVNGLRDAIVTATAEADPATAKMNDEELAEYRKKVLAEIEARDVGFHSWRHKLNTLLRAEGVPDAKIQLLTGHRSKEMTDWYTQFLETDMVDVTEAQVKLLTAD